MPVVYASCTPSQIRQLSLPTMTNNKNRLPKRFYMLLCLWSLLKKIRITHAYHPIHCSSILRFDSRPLKAASLIPLRWHHKSVAPLRVVLSPCHSSWAFLNCLLAMTMLLLNPWSSASYSGPLPMQSSFLPLHRLWSVLQGLPAKAHPKAFILEEISATCFPLDTELRGWS